MNNSNNASLSITIIYLIYSLNSYNATIINLHNKELLI